MKQKPIRHSAGFSLWYVVALLFILGALGTYVGKILAYGIKSRNKAEAKFSIIDNESTLAELVAAKLKSIYLSYPLTSNFCALTSQELKDFFLTPPEVLFPSPRIKMIIESDPAPDTTLSAFLNLPNSSVPGVQQEIANALSACAKPTTPSENTPAGLSVYLFCIALDNQQVKPQKSRSFVFSERAFVQVRVELLHKNLNHTQKLLNAPPVCAEWLGVEDEDKQIKVSYRIFWKARGDAQGYYSFTGSKLFNLADLRSV